MTNAGRWCDRCGIHRVDDPREPFCPSCQDDLHHEEAEARRGLGWEA